MLDVTVQVQVTWDNPAVLEAYITRLQAAAERITSENRRLRKCHGLMADKVKCVSVRVQVCVWHNEKKVPDKWQVLHVTRVIILILFVCDYTNL